MVQSSTNDRDLDSSITVNMLWRGVIASRRLVGVITACTVIVALIAALTATPRYDATTMVAAPLTGSGTELSELAGQFGGLVGVAGLGLGQRQNIDQTLVILQSQEFLEHFIESEGVAPFLFPERWDPVAKRWRPDRSFGGGLGSVTQAIGGWLPRDNLPQAPDGAPDPWTVFTRFSRLISIVLDKRTGIVTLTVGWRDPALAASWANSLVRRLNEEARTRAVTEANASLGYVAEQLSRTEAVELRQTLYHIAEAEQNRAMIANTRQDYALRVLAKALVPYQRAYPKRKLMVIGGLVTGLLLGMFVALSRAMLTRSNPL